MEDKKTSFFSCDLLIGKDFTSMHVGDEKGNTIETNFISIYINPFD